MKLTKDDYGDFAISQGCGNCRFFAIEGENNVCGRFPPTPVCLSSGAGYGMGSIASVRPTVSPADWCGEWAKRAASPEGRGE